MEPRREGYRRDCLLGLRQIMGVFGTNKLSSSGWSRTPSIR